MVRDLQHPDPGVRMKAARLLKDAAYPEAAVPLAPLVTDPQDEVQLEAIAAEVNIFLAEKIVPRKRVGFLIEVRNTIDAEAAFSAGPLVLGPQPVPAEVLSALRGAARDENRRIGLEALYGFGTLAAQLQGAARQELRRASGADLVALLAVNEPAIRVAAMRVVGRVFEWRRGDPAVDVPLGDAVIVALNDRDRNVRAAAMEALGAMRYERGVQALTDLFQHFRKGDQAEAALDAIAHIAHPASVPLFEAQLTGKSVTMKAIAIEGLARAGDATKVAAIEAALQGEFNESVQLAGRFAVAALSNASLEPIGDLLTKPRLRDQARQYLIELAAGRTGAFSRYVQDPEPSVRIDVADILGLAGDPAALPLIEPLTKDTDPQVVKAADRAVARLRAV
ncbi:MAG: HEAT repeat domain-containing protein [Acidobacteria bacterium]|nr:HEAT repeat domain-containing protein [Acidobacteriota bacterium]